MFWRFLSEPFSNTMDVRLSDAAGGGRSLRGEGGGTVVLVCGCRLLVSFLLSASAGGDVFRQKTERRSSCPCRYLAVIILPPSQVEYPAWRRTRWWQGPTIIPLLVMVSFPQTVPYRPRPVGISRLTLPCTRHPNNEGRFDIPSSLRRQLFSQVQVRPQQSRVPRRRKDQSSRALFSTTQGSASGIYVGSMGSCSDDTPGGVFGQSNSLCLRYGVGFSSTLESRIGPGRDETSPSHRPPLPEADIAVVYTLKRWRADTARGRLEEFTRSWRSTIRGID